MHGVYLSSAGLLCLDEKLDTTNRLRPKITWKWEFFVVNQILNGNYEQYKASVFIRCLTSYCWKRQLHKTKILVKFILPFSRSYSIPGYSSWLQIYHSLLQFVEFINRTPDFYRNSVEKICENDPKHMKNIFFLISLRKQNFRWYLIKRIKKRLVPKFTQLLIKTNMSIADMPRIIASHYERIFSRRGTVPWDYIRPYTLTRPQVELLYMTHR